MTQSNEVLVKGIKGQEPTLLNKTTRLLVTGLSEKQANKPQVINGLLKQGFDKLNGNITTTLNRQLNWRNDERALHNPAADWTRLFEKNLPDDPERVRHGRAEVQAKLPEAKAMSLSMLEMFGYNEVAEKAKKDPSILKSSFRSEANGPTIRTDFTHNGVQHNLDLTFFHQNNDYRIKPVNLVFLRTKSDNLDGKFVIDLANSITEERLKGLGANVIKPKQIAQEMDKALKSTPKFSKRYAFEPLAKK